MVLRPCRIGDLIHRVVAASRQEVRWAHNLRVCEDLLHKRNAFHPNLLVELRKYHQRVDRPLVAAGIRTVTGAMGCLVIVKNYTGDRWW